jgi:hypothetical protein
VSQDSDESRENRNNAEHPRCSGTGKTRERSKKTVTVCCPFCLLLVFRVPGCGLTRLTLLSSGENAAGSLDSRCLLPWHGTLALRPHTFVFKKKMKTNLFVDFVFCVFGSLHTGVGRRCCGRRCCGRRCCGCLKSLLSQGQTLGFLEGSPRPERRQGAHWGHSASVCRKWPRLRLARRPVTLKPRPMRKEGAHGQGGSQKQSLREGGVAQGGL